MARVTVEDCLEKVENRFQLVILLRYDFLARIVVPTNTLTTDRMLPVQLL